MEGKTSSLECAHELGRLCESRHLVVNLIPYVVHKDAADRRRCPSPGHIKEFQAIVASYGALCYVRLNMNVKLSREVAHSLSREKQESLRDVTSDIEELGFWHKLSVVRSRGWSKKAMKDRQEKRRIFVGIPREIAALFSSAVPSKPRDCLDASIASTCSVTSSDFFMDDSVGDITTLAHQADESKSVPPEGRTRLIPKLLAHQSRRCERRVIVCTVAACRIFLFVRPR